MLKLIVDFRNFANARKVFLSVIAVKRSKFYSIGETMKLFKETQNLRTDETVNDLSSLEQHAY